MKESEWEFEDVSIKDLPKDNLSAYFPENNDKHPEANLWIM